MITNKELDEVKQDLQREGLTDKGLSAYLNNIREGIEYYTLHKSFESVFQCMRIEAETMKIILLINHCNKKT